MFFKKKEDKTGKMTQNNCFRALQINQRKARNCKVFILQKLLYCWMKKVGFYQEYMAFLLGTVLPPYHLQKFGQ